jgi:hypothetical protein
MRQNSNIGFIRGHTKAAPLATELRELLDTLMEDSKALETGEICNAPTAIVFLAEHISTGIDHNKPKGATELPTTPNFLDSYAKYRQFYKPGCLYSFEVPKERQDVLPSPHCHSIEGTQLYHVDWLLSHLGVHLRYHECNNGLLVHDRLSFTKKATLFPIYHVNSLQD